MARTVRIAILGESPCSDCARTNCCRQNGHDYAVLLEFDEVARFRPFARSIPIDVDGRRINEWVLPYVNGACQFLDDDGRCLIYEDRPQNCRRFQCVRFFNNAGSTVGKHGIFLQRNSDVTLMLTELRGSSPTKE